jgi:hypothetical protein
MLMVVLLSFTVGRRKQHAASRHAHQISGRQDERGEWASIGRVRIERIELSLDENDTVMAPMSEEDRASVARSSSAPFVEPDRDIVRVPRK